MCGYQNSMFPLCIYGSQNTYRGEYTSWVFGPPTVAPKLLDYLHES